jgi:hypothetical protein
MALQIAPARVVARGSKSHVGLDGSRIDLSAANVNLDRPASAILTVYVNGRVWEFTAGYRDFGREVAADSSIVLDEQFSFQRGTVRAGSVEQSVFFPNGSSGEYVSTNFRILSWEGRNYSVHTHVYDGSTTEALAALDSFNIVETPDGIRMVRRQPAKAPYYKPPDLLKEIPEIGLLYIRQLTTDVARTLPKWPGTRVRGGELFVSGSGDGASCGTASFTLVGPNSVVIVMPDAGASSDSVVSGLSDLAVDWQAGSG